jgi:hypothetical protein
MRFQLIDLRRTEKRTEKRTENGPVFLRKVFSYNFFSVHFSVPRVFFSVPPFLVLGF